MLSMCGGAQIEQDEQYRTFQSYLNRFRSPYEQSYSPNQLYYSLDVGPMHIIMMNAVRPCPDAVSTETLVQWMLVLW